MKQEFTNTIKPGYSMLAEKVADASREAEMLNDFMLKIENDDMLRQQLKLAYKDKANIFYLKDHFDLGYESLEENQFADFDEYLENLYQFSAIDNMDFFTLSSDDIESYEGELFWKYMLNIEETEFMDGEIEYKFTNGMRYRVGYTGQRWKTWD